MKKLAFLTLFALSTNLNALFAVNEPTSSTVRIHKEKLIYPQEAIANKEEGTVYLAFEWDEEKGITNITIELGVSDSLNEAAKNVLLSLDKQELKQMNLSSGERLILPVRFRLI